MRDSGTKRVSLESWSIHSKSGTSPRGFFSRNQSGASDRSIKTSSYLTERIRKRNMSISLAYGIFFAAKTSLARCTNGQNRIPYIRSWFAFKGGHSDPQGNEQFVPDVVETDRYTWFEVLGLRHSFHRWKNSRLVISLTGMKVALSFCFVIGEKGVDERNESRLSTCEHRQHISTEVTSHRILCQAETVDTCFII